MPAVIHLENNEVITVKENPNEVAEGLNMEQIHVFHVENPNGLVEVYINRDKVLKIEPMNYTPNPIEQT